jgi:hypothetical protein
MKTLCALALGGLALAMADPASATNCSNANFKKLQFFSSDTGGILWQSPRLDSPLDTNSQRLLVHLLRQDGDDWAGAYSNCTGIEGRLVGAVRNLSFDFLNASGEPSVHIGAGAPRYSVDIDADGDGAYDFSAFLAAFYCQGTTTNPAWSRADFTGQTAIGACSIFVNNVQYTSDGARSAWKVYADANPTHKVMSWPGPAYLVMDEDAGVLGGGTAFVDRLAFHNKMYVQSGTGSAAIKNCPSESSC